MYCRILPCLLIAMMALVGSVRGEEAADRARDMAQMKRIWEALMAYKKAKGNLPDHLSDIVPEFLPDPKILLSPRDLKKDPRDFPGGEKHASSFHYEWGAEKFDGLTIGQVKTCQLEEFGPIVPLLRRYGSASVLSVSHAGDVFESHVIWEFSPEVRKLIAERGLGPGASTGKFLELTAVDPEGVPVSGVKVTVNHRRVLKAWLPARTFTSGDDGRVRVPFGPVEAMSGLLTFVKPGHFAFPQQSGKAGFPNALSVTVSRTKPVGGIVTDSKNRPLSNAIVVLAGDSKSEDAEVEWSLRQRFPFVGPSRIAAFRTGADGRWLFENVPDQPGMKLQCVMSHPDFAVKLLALDRAALLKSGYFSGKARIALTEPFTIRGEVIGQDARPSVDTMIVWFSSVDPTSDRNQLQPIEVKTNARGQFELRTRITGIAKIALVPKTGAAPRIQTITVDPGMDPMKFKLGPGRVLAGKVVNQQNKAVPDVNILFKGWLGELSLSSFPIVATTDPEGKWKWENAPLEAVFGSAILPSGSLVSWQEVNGMVPSIQVAPGDE